MQQFVFGDIHGCLDELSTMMRALPLGSGDTVAFLGDYVDRGPDSRGVVDFIVDLKDNPDYNIVCLKGNHEDMLLSFLGLGGNHGEMFLLNGGTATLASYGVYQRGKPAVDAMKFMSALPDRHLDFFRDLETFRFLDDFLCVHAGIQPLRSLSEQIEEEMIWIRDEFIQNPHPLPHTVLYGHTPMEQVFFHLPYKVGLDTGLVYGNLLSCLEISSKTLFQIKKGKKAVMTTSVAHHWEQV